MDLTDRRTIDDCFAATAPRRWGIFGLQLLLMSAVAITLLMSLMGTRWNVPDAVELAVPPAVLLLFLVTGMVSGRRRRSRREALAVAWEKVQFENPEGALQALATVIHGPIYSVSDRGQAFMSLAATCEQLNRYDSAAHIYERMLVEQIGDLSQLQEAQIKLAGAKVRNDELTDAVTLIGRLAQVPLPPPFKAMFDLVQLFQRVFMGHYEDAIQEIEPLRALFRRHLSTKAGQGYALFAAAMHRLGRTSEAARLWNDATTLIPASKLVRDFPLMQPISEAYAAAEPIL